RAPKYRGTPVSRLRLLPLEWLKAFAHRGMNPTDDALHRLLRRISDIPKPDLIPGEHALRDHVLRPSPHAVPELFPHQDERKGPDLAALDQRRGLEKFIERPQAARHHDER